MPQLTAERRTQIEADLKDIENVSRSIRRYNEEKAVLTNRLLINKKQENIDRFGCQLQEKSAAFASEYGCAPSEYRFPEEFEDESEDDSSEEEGDDEDDNEDEGSVKVTPPTSPEKSVTPESNTWKSDFQIWQEEQEAKRAEEEEVEAAFIRGFADADAEMANNLANDESTDLFGESVGDDQEAESDEDEEPQISSKPIEKQPAVARSQPSTPLNKSISRESQQPARSGGIVLPEQTARRGGIVLSAIHTPPRTSPVPSVSRPSSVSSARSTTIPRGLVLPTGIPTPPSSSPPNRPVSRVQAESTVPEQTIEQQHGRATKPAVEKPARKAKGDKKRKRSTKDASPTPAPVPKKQRPSRAKQIDVGPAKVLRPQDRPLRPTPKDKDVHTIICRGRIMDGVPRRLLQKSGAFQDAFNTGDLHVGPAHHSLDFKKVDGTLTLPEGICPDQFMTFLQFADSDDYDLSDLVSEEQLTAPNSFERMKAHAALMRLAVDLRCSKFKKAIFRNASADKFRYLRYEDQLVVGLEEHLSAQEAEKAEVLRLYGEIRSATPPSERTYNWLGDADAATSFDQSIRNYRYRTVGHV